MKKYLTLPLTAVLPFYAAAGQLGTDASSSSERPNFIVILCDDLGYADVGFNGCKDIKTPNIDRIASEGVRFTNAYVTYAVSSPSRAGIMTGRYGQRFGYERNVQYKPHNPQMGLSLEEMTIAQSLHEVGYTSCAVGKWHLGAHETKHPCNRGFDEFFGFLGGGHRYFPEEYQYYSYDVDTEEESYRTFIMKDHDHVKIDGYLSDELSDAALDFIKRNRENPFFLYLAYNAPHTPQQVTDKYLSRYQNIENPKRRNYAAMVSAVDDGVGKILDYLDLSGLSENTIVFFLSDNGGPENVNGSDNGPLRGGKGSSFEGGFRVPFAMRWPGQIPANAVYEKTISSLDIFATASGITDSPVNPERPLDGVNLIPYLTGKDSSVPHPVIYLRKYDDGIYAVRKDDHKMILYTKENNRKELFDLSKDIGENHNIAKSNQKIMTEIEKLRKVWDSQLIPPAFEGLMQLPGKQTKGQKSSKK